ncbi:hypothetical protein Patl1_08941 [Pistacia atlantica]|uniref:Uncharacterized protein n=1 Tax=Pistacia atlantica TaxID=434234 RepID=A0ACC1AKD2_9ROSI|nr:hypothetical protein Patl1_08941 [Pistacia atlantica]
MNRTGQYESHLVDSCCTNIDVFQYPLQQYNLWTTIEWKPSLEQWKCQKQLYSPSLINTANNISYIFLTSPAITPQPMLEQLASFVQISNDISLHMQCIAAIVGYFKWRKEAKKMGMMEKGYVWIVPDEIASLIDSLDSSDINNMQGVLGFRTKFIDSSNYREIAFWSPSFGLSGISSGNNSVIELGPIYWPGRMQTIPKGWNSGEEDKPLRIGVPAKGAFNQFVSGLDAAVGDIDIMADRYPFAEFTLPYVESGLEVVVPVKTRKDKGHMALHEDLYIKNVAANGRNAPVHRFRYLVN